MYGRIDGQIEFPKTPEEWATDRWFNFTIRHDPHLAWLPSGLKTRIDNFEMVIELPLADSSGHTTAAMGPGPAEDAEQLALFARCV